MDDQRRGGSAVMDDKRKAWGRAFIHQLIALVMCCSVIFLVYFIDGLKKEKAYSSSLKDGTKVYANIMDINPSYVSYPREGGALSEDRYYVCLCHSDEGEELYLYVKYPEYIDFYLGENDYDDFNGAPGGLKVQPKFDLDSILEERNRPDYFAPISYHEAVLVHGRIRDADSLADDLSEQIGMENVVLYEYLVYDDFSTE